MNHKVAISFSHTNYCLRSAGTEKFIRGFSDIIQREGYSHLNLFSFYDDRGRMRTRLFGVNYNDRFIGIYKYDVMIQVLDSLLVQYNLQVSCIHLQHLLHHDLQVISNVIARMKVPVYVMVHDYYLVCPELKLVSSNHGFCGLSSPSEEKCRGCEYDVEARRHFDNVTQFLQQISPWIKTIIAPSAYVAKGMRRILPEYKDRIVVRQHLQYDYSSMDSEINGRIRIAFAGGQMAAKGYDRWKELVANTTNREYEFYYLGTGHDEIPGVRNVYVSSAEQGDDAMSRALKDNDIHIAFLWPIWAETYSYVLYELAENGVYILTNDISGNICDVVADHGNGQIFNRMEDCIHYLKDPQTVRDQVNWYRSNGEFHIQNVKSNMTCEDLISDAEVMYRASSCKRGVGIRPLETLLYRMKYRGRL